MNWQRRSSAVGARKWVWRTASGLTQNSHKPVRTPPAARHICPASGRTDHGGGCGRLGASGHPCPSTRPATPVTCMLRPDAGWGPGPRGRPAGCGSAAQGRGCRHPMPDAESAGPSCSGRGRAAQGFHDQKLLGRHDRSSKTSSGAQSRRPACVLRHRHLDRIRPAGLAPLRGAHGGERTRPPSRRLHRDGPGRPWRPGQQADREGHVHRRLSSALTLLTCVAESGTPQAVTGLAEQTRPGKSTASRIAAELASCGVLIRSGRTGTYTLGARAPVLAGAAAPYLIEVQVALGQLRPKRARPSAWSPRPSRRSGTRPTASGRRRSSSRRERRPGRGGGSKDPPPRPDRQMSHRRSPETDSPADNTPMRRVDKCRPPSVRRPTPCFAPQALTTLCVSVPRRPGRDREPAAWQRRWRASVARSGNRNLRQRACARGETRCYGLPSERTAGAS